MDLNDFKKLPLMGILRAINLNSVSSLVQTVKTCGLKTIEVTMNTASADKLISEIKKMSQDTLVVGAGTVLSMDDLKKALDSGASFIVLPVLIKKVVEYCVKKDIPVFPGALSPQEIYDAYSMGASMVKVFPAKFFGPDYLKEIKGPFNNIELLACGGVTPQNLGQFFKSGANAIAFGASIFNKELINKGDFSSIEENLKSLIGSYHNYLSF